MDVRNELVKKQNMPKQSRDTRKKSYKAADWSFLEDNGEKALLMENQELECNSLTSESLYRVFWGNPAHFWDDFNPIIDHQRFTFGYKRIKF